MADDHRELEPGMFECHPRDVITIAIALAGQLASEIKHKPTASGQGLTVPRWYDIMKSLGGPLWWPRCNAPGWDAEAENRTLRDGWHRVGDQVRGAQAHPQAGPGQSEPDRGLEPNLAAGSRTAGSRAGWPGGLSTLGARADAPQLFDGLAGVCRVADRTGCAEHATTAPSATGDWCRGVHRRDSARTDPAEDIATRTGDAPIEPRRQSRHQRRFGP